MMERLIAETRAQSAAAHDKAMAAFEDYMMAPIGDGKTDEREAILDAANKERTRLEIRLQTLLEVAALLSERGITV